MDQNNNPQKFELERETKAPLMMFLFTVQDARTTVDFPTFLDVKAITAYDIISAVQMVQQDYLGTPITISQKGSFKVQNIINTLNLPTPIPSPKVENVKVEPPKKKTELEQKEQFIQNCMLIADQFVTEKRDRTSLKRILGRIEINEPVKIPVKKIV